MNKPEYPNKTESILIDNNFKLLNENPPRNFISIIKNTLKDHSLWIVVLNSLCRLPIIQKSDKLMTPGE